MQTFEAETPGWLKHGDRNWLRNWLRRQFHQFHIKFGGAKPSGPWAEQFTIICWPITHAILPKDLQRQLARILYELRHSFYSDVFDSPLELGELIAGRSLEASSRFQKFAQEPLLVGQIATALLIDDDGRSRTLILPSALRRIAEDLERERQSRAWLLDARKSAAKATLRGLAPTGTVPSGARNSTVEQAREQISALALEPRLLLYPNGDSSWQVWLEFPDLSPLISRFPLLRDVLIGSRFFVAGSSGRPFWQGRLLKGHQQVRLESWPKADEPLLRFERSTPEMNYLLSTACLLRPGEKWLFKIASDGLAYELRSKTVRAGQEYIYLAHLRLT